MSGARGGRDRVTCAYIPLTDCATLVAAQEMGFAAEEGIDLVLAREASWSNVRDKLALGLVDAAHMLAPMPVAMTLGLSSHPAPVAAPFMLSVNGNMVGVSAAIAARLRAAEGASYFDDAALAAAALRRASAGRPLRVGVPWLFSMHAILLDYWLGRSGFALDRDVALTVVPPPFMAEALSAGEIDMFCVGEPWGSIAVEEGVGAILLPSSAIWRFAPEKVLGVGPSLLSDRPDTLTALIRALYRAAEWASRPEHFGPLAEMLATPRRLGRPAEVIERVLRGALVAHGSGEHRSAPDALVLFEKWATFPWVSQEAWIAAQLLQRHGGSARVEAGAQVFRPDLYRRALTPMGVDLPTASAKLEGALATPVAAGSLQGGRMLGPDPFFDAAVFDADGLERA